MEKTRKWRKILAMMLTVVMMLQNAQSVMVFADVTNEQIEQRLAGNQGQTEETQPAQSQVDTRANGEEYKTQSQETQENGNGSTDIGSPESGNATTEAKTSNADVSATITQSVFQADVSGTTCNFVQMTAQITNNDTENPATGVSVKALLNSAQLSWVNGYGTETAGAGAYAVDSNNTADLPDGSADGYDQIVMWTDQTIGAGETVAYQFAAQIIPENLDGVVNAWYVDGTSCSYTWENTEILVPTQAPVEPAPEVAPPQTEPEEKPEVKPEETTPEVTPTPEVAEVPEATPTPEVTEVPEATPTPEVTEVPEATPTPEVTEVPEATPTPEVTEVPEATPTPEPTQAVDDDKQAKLDEQNKLLGQSKDRLKIKKAKAPKAQANDADTEENQQIAISENNEIPSDSECFYGGTLDNYISNFEIYTKDENGQYNKKYDSNDKLEKGGSFEMEVFFKEVANTDQQFPTEEGKKYTKVTFQIPSDKITGFRSETGTIALANKDHEAVYGNGGLYNIDNNGLVTLYLNADYVKKYPNCEGYFKFAGSFSKDIQSTTEPIEIKLTNTITKQVYFNNAELTVSKEVSSYDKENKCFNYTISVLVYGDIRGEVTLTDTMGKNLNLIEGSIEISPESSFTVTKKEANKFVLTADGLTGPATGQAYKEYKVTYKAKITDAALATNGVITDLGNTATVNYGGNKEVSDTAKPSYSHFWVEKNDGKLKDGKVEWTIRVNEGGTQDAKGLTVKDLLESEYMSYDTSSSIKMYKYEKNANGSLSQVGDSVDVDWTNVLADDNRSWSYTINEKGNYEYRFVYSTLIANNIPEGETLKNGATVTKGGQEFNDTGSYDGTGTGDGNVSKVYKGSYEKDGKIYAKWESTITVPEGTLNNVVFNDELQGNHKLPDTFNNESVKISGYDGNYFVQRKTDKSFQLYFTDKAEAANSTLTGPATITISYETIVDAANEEIGNTAKLTANGKTEVSVVPKTSSKVYVNTKKGTRIDSSTIEWKIGIDLSHQGLDGLLTVVDTISDNQSFDFSSNAPMIVDDSGRTIQGTVVIPTRNGSDHCYVFTIYGLNGQTKNAYLKYYTKILPGTSDTKFINNATIKLGDLVIGEPSDEVDTSVPIIEKGMTDPPVKDNKYLATYTMTVSGKSVNSITNNYTGDYTIVDTSSANVAIQTESLKVVRVNDDNTETDITNSIGYTYNDKILTITIPNAGKNTYKISYQALITKNSSTETSTGYSNNAQITFDGKDYVSKTQETVNIDSSGSAGIGGSLYAIKVDKVDEGNNNIKLSGAKFELYLKTNDGKILLGSGETTHGGIVFGQVENSADLKGANQVLLKKDGNDYSIAVGETYILYETKAPAGYTQIPKGEKIKVKEFTIGNSAQGYIDPNVNGTITVTNKKVTDITVNKVWNDGENQDGLRPERVKVKLQWKTNGESSYKDITSEDTWYSEATTESAEKILSISDKVGNDNSKWSSTWTKLPQYKKNSNNQYEQIDYQVVETEVLLKTGDWVPVQKSKYTSSSQRNGNEWTLTNTYKPGVKSITVKKNWDDDENRDGKRPVKVTVKLVAEYDGTTDENVSKLCELSDNNGWTHTWKDLPEYKKVDNQSYKYTYSVEELQVTYGNNKTFDVLKEGASTTTENPYVLKKNSPKTNSDKTEWIFTNKYIPEVTQINVKKEWDTKGDTSAKESAVEVTLKANVENEKGPSIDIQSLLPSGQSAKIKLTKSGKWQGSWTGLKKYYNKKKVYYSVEEAPLSEAEKWRTTYSLDKDGTTWTVKNTYTETTSVSAEKVWDDNNNQDGKRPSSIELTLYRPKLDKNGEYITDKNSVQNNDKYLNEKVYEKVLSLTANSGNSWKVSWSNLEPKWGYLETDQFKVADSLKNEKIDYQVLETSATGGDISAYEPTIQNKNGSFTITNSYVPKKISVKATKTWNDGEDTDGLRKKINKITLSLWKLETPYAGGYTKVDGIEDYEVPQKDYTKSEWKIWSDLSKYANGQLIRYRVEENIEYANGETRRYTQTYNEQSLENSYVTGENAKDSVVTIAIKNTYGSEKISVTAKKVWDDNQNRDNLRKYISSIDFELMVRNAGSKDSWEPVNGARRHYKTEDLEPNNYEINDINWSNLLKYKNGKLQEYTVVETVKYKTGTTDAQKYEDPTYSSAVSDTDGTIIVTNTHHPALVSVKVNKTWVDDNNRDNYRPENLPVTLNKVVTNGDGASEFEPVTEFPDSGTEANVKLNANKHWSYEWAKLYKYENGKEIKYQVTENMPDDVKDKYKADIKETSEGTVTTFAFTNTHERDKTKLTVVKNWIDEGENDKHRPKEINLELTADGNKIADIKLNAGNEWTWTSGNLDVYSAHTEENAGKDNRIVYKVKETTSFAEGTYEVSYQYTDGQDIVKPKEKAWTICTVTNKRETTTTKVLLYKYWYDNNNANRPEEATFQLTKQVWDGEKYGKPVDVEGTKKTIKGSSSIHLWQTSWEGLQKQENGKDIIYAVKELNVPAGYTAVITGENNIYTATNILSTIEFHKMDATGSQELEGAKMELYIYDDNNKRGSEPLVRWTSGKTPYVITSDKYPQLVPGTKCALVETAAPDGYTITKDVEFTINSDGKVQSVYMYDGATEFKVSKKTITGSSEEGLAGAKLQITKPDGTIVKVGDGEDFWISDGKTKTITNLAAGSYVLKELSAPVGYYRADDIVFEITENGEVKVKTTEGSETIDNKEITMIDYPVKVSISKKDVTGENELENAKLALYHVTDEIDSDTNQKKEELVEEWTSGKEPKVFENLIIDDEYVLKEVEAPSGYGYAADVRFTVKGDKDESVVNHVQSVAMYDGRHNIQIAKVVAGEEGVYTNIPGAKLQIKKGDEVIEEWVSETTPHVVIDKDNKIVAGETYTLHEASVPAGYVQAADIAFTVTKDGKVVYEGKADTIAGSLINMIDEPQTVTVLKTKEDGVTPLAGAKLQIVDSSKDKNDEGYVVETWTSGETAHTVEAKLSGDKTYYLEEVNAPAGYTIAERQKIDLDSTTKLISVVMKDAQTKVTISKKAITGTDSIGGAELRVIDKDGKVVVEKWTTKAGEDTTVTGVFNVGETYTLQEVTPPTGYAKAAGINFTLNKKGEIVINDKTETSVVMRDAKLQIKVSKKDITDTDELPGAVLQILDKADNSVIAEWKTTDKPVIITEKDCKKPLVAGNTYILHEKTAPDGYAYAKDVEFTVHVDSIEGNEQLVTMHDAKNVVVVSKTDLAGTKELPGAKLQILSSDGKTVLESWTSTNEEYKVTKKLKAGESYILRETEAPDGYAIADDVKFTVNKDGSTTKVVMKDAQTSVTVSKTDLTGEKEIAGAKLQILNKNGKVMEEWTSDGKTHAVTAALVADVTYILHEVSAPAGYRTAKDIEFTVDKTGKTTKVVMKDAPTKASILKTDESGKALSGAQLVVKDSTGKELDKWTSDGKAHEITGLLTVGETYTLSEVSAPSGYTVAPDQTFKMEDKDVIEVTMVDYQASGSGQITVTKKVTYANGGDFIDLIAQDDTFYVNLFTDAAGKYPYKGALPQAIHLVNASAGSVTFSDLAQGTYYVYETDANGNVINLDQQGMHNGSQFMCTVDGGSNTVKLDLKAGPKEGAVNLENVFFDIPTGYSYKGEININKQVLKGTTQTTTDDTFYAGVFTKGDDGVYNLFTVVQLVQNDTVTVEVPLGGKDGTEPINYYILETDADGNILDLDVFEYEVTGEGTVALSKDNLAGNINLVNKIPEDTDGKLRVQKTDGNGVGLAGASFRLTDEDGSVIDEWTSEASAHELELEPGTYTLTEVQAPTGYTGAGSVTIKVDDDYDFSVSGEIDYSYKGGLLKIVNKATTSTPSSGTPVSGGSTPASYSSALSGKVAVKTGDNTPIGAYAAVLVIAALAIAGGIFYKKKRKNDK